MKCDVCHRDFYSPYSDLVSVCSRCIARGTGAVDAPSRQGDGVGNWSDESTDFVGGEELAGLFPEFEIGERLGAGGMGVVFRARQKSLDRSVAIKVLNPKTQGDADFEERFEREAKAMAMLGHPNIVGIHDFGIRGPYHFLVMEHVEGRDLQKLIRSGSLDSDLAFSIIHQVCDALHHAHERGIVHRDLKPGNILVGHDGVAKIGDFGLAQIGQTDGDVPLTMANAAMGTPAYMAPEQLTDARTSDARSDIFALGVVVYEILTGSPPAGNFPPPTSRLPHRNRRLDEAVLRAMDPDPANRLPDVREISKIVAEWKLPDPVERKAGKMVHRWLVLLAPALIVTMAGAGWIKWSKRNSDNGSPLMGAPRSPAPPTLEKLLPKAGLRGTEEYERMRRRGGVLRRWSEMPEMVDIEAASGINDLVYVEAAPNIAMSWYAARSNGQMISSQPGLGSRNDYRRVSHSFFIEWPDRLVPSSPPSGREYISLLQPTPRASDLTQSFDLALAMTPEGRLAFGASDSWVKSHRYVLDRLEGLENVVAVESWVRQFAVLTVDGRAHCWIEPHGFFDPPEDERKLVQVAAGSQHLIGLYEDGVVVTWCHPLSLRHPRVASALSVPPDLGPVIRVKSWDFSNAAQRPDGSWFAWGDDEGRGLIDQVNSIGPALDFETFHVNNTTGAKLIWIDPHPSDSGAEERTPPEKVGAPPLLEKLLPKAGLMGTDEFERMRRRGGILRRWSEKPGVVDIEDASGIDDLVFVEWAPRSATRWYAARSNGEMISSQTGLGARSDYRRISHSFLIEWPDRLVPLSFPPSAQETLPFLEPIPRVSDLTQSYDVALVLTPEHRIALAAKDSWVKSNRPIIDRLDGLRDVVAVDSMVNQFVVLTAEGKAISWCEPNGFFDPPEDERKLVQVAAGAKHLIGLYEDGSVVTWCHKTSWMQSWLPSVMRVPPDLGPIIRVASFGSINAVQRPDGSWLAWGDDGNRGLIDQINSIGPALDLEAFRVTFSTGAKMIWIEPAPLHNEKTAVESPTPSGQ